MKFMNLNYRTFRLFALSFATILFAVGPALAASTTTPASHPPLKTTNAMLNHSLNAIHLERGQRVTAHLTMNMRAANGLRLPRNTRLIGKISNIQVARNHGMSLSLVFTKAQLKDGRVVPIKATVMRALRPASPFLTWQYLPSASRLVAPHAAVIQEPGMLNHHIRLHSAVRSHNSATFERKNGNIELRRGTRLRIAIAPLQKSTTTAG